MRKVFEGASPLTQQVRSFTPNTNPFAAQTDEQIFVPTNHRKEENARVGTPIKGTSGFDGQEEQPVNGPTGKTVTECTPRTGKIRKIALE